VNRKALMNLREKAGLTQSALAAKAGIAGAAVSYAEAGKRTVNSVSLRRIADALAEELGEDVGAVLKALTDPE